MIVKIKKYVAKVTDFVEHDDGSITKEVYDVNIRGRRISETSVWKQIPRTAKLISHGYIETAYDVDGEKLSAWLAENGTVVEAVEA